MTIDRHDQVCEMLAWLALSHFVSRIRPLGGRLSLPIYGKRYIVTLCCWIIGAKSDHSKRLHIWAVYRAISSIRSISQQKAVVLLSGFQNQTRIFHPNTEKKVSPLEMLASSSLLGHLISFSTSTNQQNTLLTVIVLATFSLLIHLSDPMISVLLRYLELVVFWRAHQLNESVAVPTGMIQCLGLTFIT